MQPLFDYIAVSPATFWMLLAGLLLILEVTVLTGVGILFAAFGSFTLGALVFAGVIDANISVVSQFAWFFGFTSAWAALLWKPLRNWYKKCQSYDNYRGTTAIVSRNSLEKDKIGFVRWSGADMRARLISESPKETIEVDQEVWVHHSKDGILYVCSQEPENKADCQTDKTSITE